MFGRPVGVGLPLLLLVALDGLGWAVPPLTASEVPLITSHIGPVQLPPYYCDHILPACFECGDLGRQVLPQEVFEPLYTFFLG